MELSIIQSIFNSGRQTTTTQSKMTTQLEWNKNKMYSVNNKQNLT